MTLAAWRTSNALEQQEAQAASTPFVSVSLYGAVGDGKIIYDAAMLNGSAILTSVLSRFSLTDVGKTVRVEGAGAGSAARSGTILSFQSTGQVTCSFTNASGANISAKIAIWGTDDTAAIQAAVDSFKIGATQTGNGTLLFGKPGGGQAMYLATNNITFGTGFDGATITSYNFGYINGDVDGAGNPYQSTAIFWAGADGTGKAIFDFGNNCAFNTVSNLGFVCGKDNKGVWFHPPAASGHLSGNRVRNCQFGANSSQAPAGGSIGVLFGFDLADTTHDADMAVEQVTDCFFYDNLQYGIALNATNNGYTTKLENNAFYMLGRDAGQRAIYVRQWNTLDINGLTCSSATWVDGAYLIEVNGLLNGWLNLSNAYIEVPLVLKAPSGVFGVGVGGVKFDGVYVNTSTTSASRAVDIANSSSTMIVFNSGMSSNKSGVQQRTIFCGGGGVVIGGSLDGNDALQGAAGAVYDTYNANADFGWVRIGTVAGTQGNKLAMLIPNDFQIASLDNGGNKRRLIGMDSTNQVRIGLDASPTVLDGNKLLTNAAVSGVATLGASGQVTVPTTAIGAGSTVLLSFITDGGTPGAKLKVGTRNNGVNFRIDSDNAADRSVVGWMVMN